MTFYAKLSDAFSSFRSFLVDRPLRPGSQLHRRYTIERLLGIGGHGIVYLVWDELLQQHGVLKQLKPSLRKQAKGADLYRAEISVLSRLNHPGIPQLVDHFSERGQLFLVISYMAGSTLEDRLFQEGKVYSEREAFQILWQLLEIVEYLHSQQVIHRDLRIPNIIQNGANLYLIDFGLARFLGEPLASDESVAGEPYIDEKRLKREISCRSDFYSLGHFLLFLLYSNYDSGGQEERSWQEELAISPESKRIIRKLLQLEEPYPDVKELIADVDNQIELLNKENLAFAKSLDL